MLKELATSIVYDGLKKAFRAIPEALDGRRFKQFFGPDATRGERVFAVVDPYTHPLPRVGNRYVKKFLGRKPDQPLIGEDNVLGTNVLRVVTYVTTTFSQYRQQTKPINVVADEAVAGHWDATFICFGSSDSNIKTFDIEQLPEQRFYSFSFSSTGQRQYVVGGKAYTVTRSKDYGIILRIRNPRHKEHFLFVCAGNGEWGTSGAAYFLFDRWKSLYKTHGTHDFCKVVEVDIGSDESAHEVHSIP